MSNEIIESIVQGASEMGVHVNPLVLTTFDRYLQMLQKWNRAYNLTAVRDPRMMVPRHVLDSLAVVPYLKGDRLLDVGTGPGLPGIVLALVSPNTHVTLLDSSNKKIKFLRQVQMELAIHNIDVVQARVEEFQTDPYDQIISRAFSSIVQFTQLSQHLLKPDGEWLAMKGSYPLTELEEILPPFVAKDVIPLTVPTLDADRHLIVVRKE